MVFIDSPKKQEGRLSATFLPATEATGGIDTILPSDHRFVNADYPIIAAILAESGLSILGLGPQQEMTLGMMIYWALDDSAIFLNSWWWWLTPVVTLIVLFLALYPVAGAASAPSPAAVPAITPSSHGDLAACATVPSSASTPPSQPGVLSTEP